MNQDYLQKGVYAAALTPMHSNLKCDYQTLYTHCTNLIHKGCQGVALFGTTGEGASFSTHERLEVLNQLISRGLDPRKIIIANGSSSLLETVELANFATKHSCAAMLIAPPCFYKHVSDEGVLAYYREIIWRVAHPSLRILLYHIPQLSGVPISFNIVNALVGEFSKIVVGLKESEGNISFTKKLVETFPGFKVYVGKETQIAEAVKMGAAGSICGIANLYPELICNLYHESKTGSGESHNIIEVISEILRGSSFIASAKAIMEKNEGDFWSMIRPPLTPLTSGEKEALYSQVEKFK